MLTRIIEKQRLQIEKKIHPEYGIVIGMGIEESEEELIKLMKGLKKLLQKNYFNRQIEREENDLSSNDTDTFINSLRLKEVTL